MVALGLVAMFYPTLTLPEFGEGTGSVVLVLMQVTFGLDLSWGISSYLLELAL